ncbi:MerR family transcriptional regulator [Streptomyces sp. NRRL B-1140]|uniref:transcriptional regulator FtsR n=1 Tax=Streptomyces sp. NRRL B-1140 TaxID=1415549 RepID=UPI0006B0363F|nr:MerR family transcriptional regulator [Streptomyces sp. NRRL B-1140]KOV94752.1 MerR family transcriptional regulator [Streptomyces sp. NRRL B-1140]
MLHTPSGGAGHGTAATDSGLMSIGAVLNALRGEFPEVTISKIRFLESEGLIEPQRTPSGYRKFSAQDVERLGHVLRMQRDHYLPLRVIREHLEAMERGEAVQLPVVGRQRDGQSASEPLEPPSAARIGRDELLSAVGVDAQELEKWQSYGLLTPVEDGAYDAEAVTVALLVVELGRFGIEPRHLRAMKAAAEREAGLVDQVVAPLKRHRNPQTRAHAEARAKELAGLTVKLHAALVRTALGLRLP